MKNKIVCSICFHENPYYSLTCNNCKTYLRDRIYNIDLGNILARIIDSPSAGFQKIIQSEHKNYLIWIFFFSAIKLFVDTLFFAAAFPVGGLNLNWVSGLLLTIASYFLLIIFSAYIVTAILNKNNAPSRLFDNFSILTYAFTPHALSIFLFIIELIVFGGYLFSYDPSPFFLKETLAYTLLVCELLIILWGIFLTVTAIYVQTKSKMFAIIFGVFYNCLVFFIIYVLSIFVY